ncbi:sulfurtransferase TusA family protein [Anaerobacillus sp. CMMVII]|uniref:sulfurtransferase TusA family protein n=1 Tax=Anaerobacillus sp. CMMVII TaxID=2755588 RepID=UPI0021B72FB3|nr:sulfurtransferase TusA family protein [Anaerobacillus sp. CMMVII]MCT8139327.1 sulfurtransferase TusA family protein [Anaerobacillus sp. CMMVII]
MIKTDQTLDAKGLACPMPIVRTKKAIGELQPGQVLEIQATDKGSTADLKAWSERTGNQYLGTIEEAGVLKHYLRKASGEDEKPETSHPHIAQNEDLEKKLGVANVTLLDVREEAEFMFNHIPGAVSIPLGELENRLTELTKEDEIYVICRTGSRSDFAAQKLAQNGFTKVWNVVPGICKWNGPTEKIL